MLDNTLSTDKATLSFLYSLQIKGFFPIVYYCKQIVIDKGYNILVIHIMLIVLEDILPEDIVLICCSMPHRSLQPHIQVSTNLWAICLSLKKTCTKKVYIFSNLTA